jgi:hypothetical protein
MKSILGLGYLPKTDPLSSQAWLGGKLFVGLLIERMIHTAESFFPRATPWQPRRSRWREIEFLYRQVGSALLLPHSLSTVLRQWGVILPCPTRAPAQQGPLQLFLG